MARYLTPSKIGLLALTALYTESVVPNTSSIPILSFLVDFLLPIQGIAGTQSRVGSGSNTSLSLEDFQNTTVGHASGIPGRTIWDLLLRKLWSIDSFDELHVFFDSLSELLVKSQEQQQQDIENGYPPPSSEKLLLSRSSPLGTFVRRAQLEFVRIQFHDSMDLWKAFIAYRQPTLPMWRKRNSSVNDLSFDVNLLGVDEDLISRIVDVVYGDVKNSDPSLKFGRFSTDDVEKLLEFQVEEMQRMGSRIPDPIKRQLQEIVKSNVTIPSLSHYVKFLDSWRSGDYPSSFDNLHRYFDYTMQNKDRTFYQYALLNLAVLQADFGCYGEAIAAMQETISTARENKDMACLNFSLSWLYHFSKSHPGELNGAGREMLLGSEQEGLAFLRTKAKESGMWSLSSTSLLSEAKLGLSNGESVATAFENILKSSHLNVTQNLANVFGSQLAMQSSLWSRLGVCHLAWSNCEVFEECYAAQSPLEDVLKMKYRSAYLLSEKGQYGAAKLQLDTIDPETLRGLKAYQYWLLFSGIIKVKMELHRDNLEACGKLLAKLMSQIITDPEICFEIDLLHIDFLTRSLAYGEALSKIESLAKKLKEHNDDVYHRIMLLTLKALTLNKCGKPEKGFSIAVRAASTAWRARIYPALWFAMAAIGNIAIHMREFEYAQEVLASIMPRVLECEDAARSAQVYSLLVDAHVGMAGEAKPDTLKRKEQLTKALEMLDSAFTEYSHIEDIKGQCEMMAKKATLMRLVGDNVLANDCAAKYLDLQKNKTEMEKPA